MYTATYSGEPLFDPRDQELLLYDQECTVEVNGAGSYTFTVPPGHPLNGLFTPMSKHDDVVLSWDGETVFRGRVTSCRTDMYGSQEVSCEGERAYLNDVMLPAYDTSDGTGGAPAGVDELFEWYLAQYNAKAEERDRFEVGVNEGALLDPNNYVYRASTAQRASVWDEMRDKLLDGLGGLTRVRYEGGVRYMDLLASPASEASQRIEFGENLLDYASTLSGDAVYTRVVPTGTYEAEDGTTATVDISGVADRPLGGGYYKQGDAVVDADAEARLGTIERAYEAEDVSDPETLVQSALALLKASGAAETVEVTALDLSLLGVEERIAVGDAVRVVSAPHRLDATWLCRSVTVHPDAPETDTFTLGAEPASYLAGRDEAVASAAAAAERASAEVAEERSLRQEALDALSAKVDAGRGLYTTREVLEDGSSAWYLHDRPGLKESRTVWKMTTDAVAVSTDGGETWSYGLAADGVAVLNRLYAIGIDADYVTSGRLQDRSGSSYIDLDTGEFCLSAGTSGGISCTLDADGRLRLSVTADSFALTAGGSVASSADVEAVAGAAVTGVYDEYAVSASRDEAPDGGWSGGTPAWSDGSWVWRRTVTCYGDGTESRGEPVCVTGASGSDAALLRIESSRGTMFKQNNVATTLSVKIYYGGLTVADPDALASAFGAGARLEWSWARGPDGAGGTVLSTDSRLSRGGFDLEVGPDDVDGQVTFSCSLVTG